MGLVEAAYYSDRAPLSSQKSIRAPHLKAGRQPAAVGLGAPDSRPSVPQSKERAGAQTDGSGAQARGGGVMGGPVTAASA